MNPTCYLVDAAALQKFCAALFIHEGVPEQDAEITARILVDANLSGVDSHGVSRVVAYLHRLRAGGTRKTAKIDTISDSGSTAAWDANGSLGQVVAWQAMRCALAKARQTGVGIVTVKGNNHTGANAWYVRMAAEAGMIGLVAGNGPPMVAPWGSSTPFFSTNPISFGAPGGSAGNIVIDMATSVSARGKIMLAAKNGASIPLGWAVDSSGKDTDNPEAALSGALLPFGGYKGYALALIVEVLAGVLSGAGYGTLLNEHYNRHDVPVNSGNFFMAIDIDRFVPLARFKKMVDEMITAIHAGNVRPDFEEILLPGEKEARTRKERLELGIPVSKAVFEELVAAGQQFGLTLEQK